MGVVTAASAPRTAPSTCRLRLLLRWRGGATDGGVAIGMPVGSRVQDQDCLHNFQDGVCGCSEQNLGVELIRAAQNSAGGDNRWHGNRCIAEKFAQRADVSDMSGYVEKHHDNQGVSA